ncbi:alpha/beta hydrolase [Nocardia sp. NPDC005978]|uniref:alpha/beta fold hydrolase n=1 Tax=Nocardia sp. NPDC005978 TaxID=3156725 RepID=UPI0033AEB5A8
MGTNTTLDETETADVTTGMERHDLLVDGRRVAYTLAGTGPGLCVLVHGLGGCRRHWAPTIPALARTRRVIAVDLPGFGDSERPRTPAIANAVAVIEALRITHDANHIDIAGHSMGTLVACEAATRNPHTINRVVLACGPITSVLSLFEAPLATLRRDPKLANFLIEAATAGLPLPSPLQSLIARTPWARHLALAPYVPHPAEIPKTTVEHFLSGAGAPGTLATLRQGFGYDFTPALTLPHPTLLIGGAQDRIAPPPDLHAFAAAAPTPRTVRILPRTGHLPMLERPAEFNTLVDQFLSPTPH